MHFFVLHSTHTHCGICIRKHWLQTISVQVWIPTAVFFMTIFFGHLLFGAPEDWWLDKLCIHQSREKLKEQGGVALRTAHDEIMGWWWLMGLMGWIPSWRKWLVWMGSFLDRFGIRKAGKPSGNLPQSCLSESFPTGIWDQLGQLLEIWNDDDDDVFLKYPTVELGEIGMTNGAYFGMIWG